MDNKKVIEFYDKFAEEQQNIGVNDRIWGLYARTKALGLNSGSSVLELGCGIGTMSFLISKTVKKGRVEAVDISPRSIAFAKQRIKGKNMNFFAADIVSYSPSIKHPDFITLFDIIEHIPVEKHSGLFRNISQFAGPNTKILINIPSPQNIEFDKKNAPQKLQVIDQPLPLRGIVNDLSDSGLQLISFENYSIWSHHDYQFFHVQKERSPERILLSEKRTLFEKGMKKMQRAWIKLTNEYR